MLDSITKKLLLDTLETNGITRHGIWYWHPGNRGSGSINTSCGNSILNGVVCLWTCYMYSKLFLKIDFNLQNPPVAILVQGDDSLVFGHQDLLLAMKDSSFWSDSFLMFGMITKFVTVTKNIFDADYCSRLFWPAEHAFGYVLAPKPGLLFKNGWTREKIPNPYQHMRGVALGLKDDVSHVPFLNKYVDMLLRVTDGTDSPTKLNKDQYNQYSLHTKIAYSPLESAYDLLYHRYGLTKDDEAEFCLLLDEIQNFPYWIQHSAVDRLIEIDYC